MGGMGMDRGSFAWGGVLLAGLAASSLGAQSLALPASDPVGIARGGAGVAFGRSLEASALNPALLVTVVDRRSAYLAGGMELESGQLTLQSNQRTLFSSDRNRFMPALGAAWKVGTGSSSDWSSTRPFPATSRCRWSPPPASWATTWPCGPTGFSCRRATRSPTGSRSGSGSGSPGSPTTPPQPSAPRCRWIRPRPSRPATPPRGWWRPGSSRPARAPRRPFRRGSASPSTRAGPWAGPCRARSKAR